MSAQREKETMNHIEGCHERHLATPATCNCPCHVTKVVVPDLTDSEIGNLSQHPKELAPAKPGVSYIPTADFDIEAYITDLPWHTRPSQNRYSADEMKTLIAGNLRLLYHLLKSKGLSTAAPPETSTSCLVCGYAPDLAKQEHMPGVWHEASGAHVCIECRNNAQIVLSLGLSIDELRKAATLYRARSTRPKTTRLAKAVTSKDAGSRKKGNTIRRTCDGFVAG